VSKYGRKNIGIKISAQGIQGSANGIPDMYVLWRKILLNNCIQITYHRTLSMTVIHLVGTIHCLTGGVIRQVISLCTYFHTVETYCVSDGVNLQRNTTCTYFHPSEIPSICQMILIVTWLQCILTYSIVQSPS